jgi:hypothetical protein
MQKVDTVFQSENDVASQFFQTMFQQKKLTEK